MSTTDELLSRIPRTAVSKLRSLLGGKQLTPDGLRYIVNAADPFSDQPIEAVGYPDSCGVNTVCYVVTEQTTISAPTGTVANWDCHVAFMPFMSPTGAQSTYVTRANAVGQPTWFAPLSDTSGPPTETASYSMFTVQACPAGDSTFLNSADFPRSPLYQSTDHLAQYGNAPARIVSAGFEVTNTTAPLYKQGTVTTYRQPAVVQADYLAMTDPFNNLVPTTAHTHYPEQREFNLLTLPPATAADVNQLLQFGGARQWDADEGCYVVAAQNSVVNPLQSASNVPIGFRVANAATGWSSLQLNPNGSYGLPVGVELVANTAFLDSVLAPVTSGLLSNSLSPSMNRVLPYDQSGAYFQGLSPQTTFQLVTRVIIEVAPDIGNTSVLSLAHPSPAYDPLALEMLTRTMRELPTGVMVKENGLGDWFADVAGDLVSLIPVVGRFAAPLARQAVRYVADKASDQRTAARATAQGQDASAAVKAKRQKRKAKRQSMTANAPPAPRPLPKVPGKP
jgi:hypothetical protein